jgi:hypothetical protein
MNNLFCVGALALVTAAAGAADFTYVETSEITGGSMKRVIDIAAKFSKKASGPQVNTHRFSGGKMSIQTEDSNTIFDADAETITYIDTAKKEYSVITFAEMAEAIERAMAKMGQTPKGSTVQVNWKASVELTGKTKAVTGLDTKEAILKVSMEGRDANSPAMGMTELEMDMWIGVIPGYQAVQEFQRRMASKMMTSGAMNPMMMAQLGEGSMKAMVEAGKKLSELEGIPLESVMRMKGLVVGMPAMPPRPQVEAPSAGEVAGAAGESVARGRFGGLGGSMGGMLGGRLGRRKKEEPPAEAAPAAPAAAAGDGIMMETVSRVTSFHSNPVDASAFAVPAGFKRVEHPVKRMAQ